MVLWWLQKNGRAKKKFPSSFGAVVGSGINIHNYEQTDGCMIQELCLLHRKSHWTVHGVTMYRTGVMW